MNDDDLDGGDRQKIKVVIVCGDLLKRLFRLCNRSTLIGNALSGGDSQVHYTL